LSARPAREIVPRSKTGQARGFSRYANRSPDLFLCGKQSLSLVKALHKPALRFFPLWEPACQLIQNNLPKTEFLLAPRLHFTAADL
jgi:hypothetical protein